MTVLFPTALPTAGWATTRGSRRVAADAAAVRTSPSTPAFNAPTSPNTPALNAPTAAGSAAPGPTAPSPSAPSPTAFAAAVADGIGDTEAAASAARFAAAEAVDAAWRAGASEAMEDVRRGLHLTTHPTNPLGIPLPRPTAETSPLPSAATLPQPPARDAGRDLTPRADTTLVVASGTTHHWSVAWVGDCRAYFLGDTDPATLLTTDHTIGRYLRDRGVPANPRLDLVVTTTARKGGHGVVHGSGPGRLVLLTNGVHRATDQATITHLARTTTDPAEAARALVALTQDDNAAAVVVDLR
ncbi:PP2C family protein-serine/threonine phosphatase [Saccharothrix variisporea]|uniref:Protein phosphatase 2C-like protein n=1 Tax=Saccharothrix variisporea TaxID=543527 RepID=A0A495X6Y5_9PSEU|nr:protein phosphatase 2C domain-containing protein [Saccharothrix variisporea]RKT67268.1 protein phosphatase 2C-like protein [Saccharothrix variisporea]